MNIAKLIIYIIKTIKMLLIILHFNFNYYLPNLILVHKVNSKFYNKIIFIKKTLI